MNPNPPAEVPTPRTDHIWSCINVYGPADRAVKILEAHRQLERENIELLAALTWQPIETAPKDGTEILGWREGCGVLLIRWTCPIDFLTDTECEKMGDSAEQLDWFYADFVAGDRLEGSQAPTHWMPLPAAIKSASGETI